MKLKYTKIKIENDKSIRNNARSKILCIVQFILSSMSPLYSVNVYE